MPRIISVAGLVLASVIGMNTIVAGQETVPSSSDILLADSSATQKELLLFYEETDLFTATKRTTTLRKAPAIATIVTADEIRDMGARNLLDVLKMVPGFGISVTETGYKMLEVRGIRSYLSEKILIMIDGHSLNRNITGSALYTSVEMLPLEHIKQVEVIRGPGSALYGNSAFVATVNVITRNAEEIDGLEVKGGGGSFDTWKANMVGGKTIGDKVTVFGSFDHYQTNGARLTVEADTLTGTPFSMAPGTPDLGFKQSDAFLKIGSGDLSLRGGYRSVHQTAYIGFGPALTDDNYGDHDVYWTELAQSFHLTEDLSASLKMYYDHWSQNSKVKVYPNGFGGIYPFGVIGKPLAKNRTVGGELQIDWDIFEGNHLISGISYEDTHQYDVMQFANFNTPTSIVEVDNWNQDARRRIFAAYLQDEWQFVESVNATFGVRYDNYSDFGETVNPRVGLVWSFLDNADLKLLYGQAFRAPNFQELYNINNPAQLGSPSLKPEKITTYEAGLAWRFSRYFAASMNYFNSTIKNQIDVDPEAIPAPTYDNMRKSKTQGVETGIHGAYGTELEWQINYAWQDPRNAQTDSRLPYVPSQRASASVNYAPAKYVNLHGDILWTGPRLRSETDTRPEMPSYTTVDVAISLKNFFKTLEIQATVRNLFDQQYKDPDTSGGNVNFAGTGPRVPNDFPREGISTFVTVSYRF